MRRRKRSIAQWLFLATGLVLLLVTAAAVVVFAASQGWLSPEWSTRVKSVLEEAWRYLPNEDRLKFLAWLAGIVGSAVGAAFTLLASWHFAEMNLPRRIEDLKKAHAKEHFGPTPFPWTVEVLGSGYTI